MTSIYVVLKGLDVFVGKLEEAGKQGLILTEARKIKTRDAVFVATFGVDDTDMKNHVSPKMDRLVIYRPDLLIKPQKDICEQISLICKMDAIANEP